MHALRFNRAIPARRSRHAQNFRRLATWCLLNTLVASTLQTTLVHAQDSAKPPVSTSMADTANDTLEQAVAAYENAMDANGRDVRVSRFSRAEQLFRQAIEEEPENAVPSSDLYLNLGNSALQAEHLGVAVAAFRQALALEPNHPRASQNLNYARNVLPDWVRPDASSELTETLFFWKAFLPTLKIRLLAALAFVATTILLLLWLATGKSIWRNLAPLPAAVWLILLASVTGFAGGKSLEAVIVAGDTILYSADSANSSPRMSQPLPDGTEVVVITELDRWCEIQLGSRSGWVRRSALQFLDSPS